MDKYDRREIPLSAQAFVKLAGGVRGSLTSKIYDIHAAMIEDGPDRKNDGALLWAWVAATAYRAGRLSMWRDCRKLQAKRAHK